MLRTVKLCLPKTVLRYAIIFVSSNFVFFFKFWTIKFLQLVEKYLKVQFKASPLPATLDEKILLSV